MIVRHKIVLLSGAAFALLALGIFVYTTPNMLLKMLGPKRYVFNCLVNTSTKLSRETDGMDGNAYLQHTLKLMLNKTDILNMSICDTPDRFAVSCPQLLGNSQKGFEKDASLLKTYLNTQYIYNTLFRLKSRDTRFFGGADNDGSLLATDEFTLTLNPTGVKKLTSGISDPYILSVLNELTERAVIRVNTGRNHCITGISITKDDVYMQLLSKNSNVLINDLELFVKKKSGGDSMILNIKSSGEHAYGKDKFTDQTSVLYISSYVQYMKLAINTQASNGSFSTLLEGKALMIPFTINMNGSYNEKGLTSAVNLNIESFWGQDISKEFELDYSSSNDATTGFSGDKVSNLWSFTGEELRNISNNLYALLRKCTSKGSDTP